MELSNEITRPLPVITKDTEMYWESAKQGNVVIQKCTDCGFMQHYPRMFCTSCLSEQMEWIETKGIGTIYSYSIAYRPANEYMKSKVPYAVALVEIPEGVRILTNIVNTPLESIGIGNRVKLTFENIGGGIQLPMFEQV